MKLNLCFFGGRGSSIGGGGGGGVSEYQKSIDRAAGEAAGIYAGNPYVQKLAEIYVDASKKNNGMEYSMNVNVWDKAANKRLYLSISERRAGGGKLMGKREYGYVDVQSGKYFTAGKSGDLSGSTLYGYSGSKIR